MRCKLVILLFTIFFSNNLFVYGQDDWKKLTVIGNSTGESELSKQQLKDVFLGNVENWTTGNSVVVVLPSSDYLNADEITAVVVGKNLNSIRRYWLGLVFQGRVNPPVYLSTNEKIINYINEVPGSIGVMLNYDGPKIGAEIQIK